MSTLPEHRRAPLVIGRRFNGPPASANGGWVSGCLARRLGERSVSVSLRAPPPLDEPLEVRDEDGGGLSLWHGTTLLAQASAEGFELEVPAAPSLDEARRSGLTALEAGLQRASWPYSRCFGCGALRHDGLRVTPGPVPGRRLVASAWTPQPDLAEGDGLASVESVWAALDCPAGIAWSFELPQSQPMVTARITARIERRPRIGEECVVIGWPIARDGRKLQAGTALLDAGGSIMAKTVQLWLIPRN